MMSLLIQNPFDNESEAAQLEDLTIENRMDRVSLYGSIDITYDQPGLEKAMMLKTLCDRVLSKLMDAQNNGTLVDQIRVIAPVTINNPFSSES